MKPQDLGLLETHTRRLEPTVSSKAEGGKEYKHLKKTLKTCGYPSGASSNQQRCTGNKVKHQLERNRRTNRTLLFIMSHVCQRNSGEFSPIMTYQCTQLHFPKTPRHKLKNMVYAVQYIKECYLDSLPGNITNCANGF